MSLPKKGSRVIEIESGSYRWLIRKKPTYAQGIAHGTLMVAIEDTRDDARGVLLVDTQIFRPDNWVKPNQTAVTPSVIRKMIQGAIKEGWNPNSNETFQFQYQLICDGIN